MEKILSHFKYPTTWVSIIVATAGIFGFVITPEMQAEIEKVTVAVVSAILFFYSDNDVKEN